MVMPSAVALKTSLKKPRAYEKKPAPWEKNLKKMLLRAECSTAALWQEAAREWPWRRVRRVQRRD